MLEKQRLVGCCQCQPALRLTTQCKISLVFNTSQVISTWRWANPGRFMTPMIQKKFGTTLERRIHFIMAVHHLCNTATGGTATKEVNVCDVKQIEQRILDSMTGKSVDEYVFKNKD